MRATLRTLLATALVGLSAVARAGEGGHDAAMREAPASPREETASQDAPKPAREAAKVDPTTTGSLPGTLVIRPQSAPVRADDPFP